MPAAKSYLSTQASTADQSSYTFAGVALGDAAADRVVAAVVAHRINVDAQLTGCTLGGVTAAEVARVHRLSGSSRNGLSIYAAAVPTGTTGDVAVTLSAATGRIAVMLYRLTGVGTPTGVTVEGPSGDDRVAGTVTAPTGAVVIGGAMMGGTGGARPVTWDGPLVEDADVSAGDGNMQSSTASVLPVTPLTDAAVTATFAGAGFSSGMPTLAIAVWPEFVAPSAAPPVLFDPPAALPRSASPFPRASLYAA